MQQEAGNELNEEREVGFTAIEYNRLVELIDDLEPIDQLAILTRAEAHIQNQEVKSLHETTVKYVKAQLNGEIDRNSIAHNFSRVWEKNPVVVAVACVAFLMLIFKVGYSVTSIITTVNAGGFWGTN